LKGDEKVSGKIRTKRAVVFAVGTALLTAALFTVAAIAEDEPSFNELRYPGA
jgi:hypothetical protein